MRNIAFSGKMASGKDTMGKYFQKAFPKAIQISFAQPLRQEIDNCLEALRREEDLKGISDDILKLLKEESRKETTAKDKTESMRNILQKYGTDYRRKEDPDYWCKKIETQLQKHKDWLFCLTDVRFKNELEMVKRNNFFTVYLDISEEEQKRRVLERDGFFPTNKQKEHSSENQELSKDYFDVIVKVDGKSSQEVFHEIMRNYRKFI